MRSCSLPALSIVELHPIVFAVFDLSRALQRLREKLPQVVVIGSVLKAKVADVAQVLVEFLCKVVSKGVAESVRCANLEVPRKDP